MPDPRPAGYNPYAGYLRPEPAPVRFNPEMLARYEAGRMADAGEYGAEDRAPNYFSRFLGNLGDSLEKPGRFVKAAVSAVGSGLGLNAPPDRSEALSFLPFSDSLGLTDPRNATKGSALSSQWTGLAPDAWQNQILGFGMDVGLDPTTYMGAGLGKAAGKGLGAAAERAAMARGPGYSTTANDLARMMVGVKDEQGMVGRRMAEIRQLPDGGAGIRAEIHPDSRIIGAGAEAVTFASPLGRVTRVGRSPVEAMGRPVSEDIVQATRTVDYPRNAALNQRVENLPFASPAPGGRPIPPDLAARLESQGLKFTDPNAGNWGMAGGRSVVIDPGAVDVLPAFAGGFSPVVAARAPDRVERFLLDMLGGQRAMRSALERGLSAPAYQRRLGQAGQAAGGMAGAGLGQIGR